MVDWLNLCHDIVVAQFENRDKTEETGVKNKSINLFFQEKCKYHRGRLHVGEKQPSEQNGNRKDSRSEDKIKTSQKITRQEFRAPGILVCVCSDQIDEFSRF